MERKYIAFISYRHARLDTSVARQLHSLIEKYTIPRDLRRYRNGKKHLGIVFRDQDELAVASDLSKELCQALDNSEFLLVVCTSETLKSKWVSQEIRYFLSNKTHDRRHVLAVLAEGEPAEAFPQILTWDEDQNRVVDPLAADVRAADSVTRTRLVRRESMRLFASMLGCNYDDLIQRERRRRVRLWASAAAAVLAVTVAFSSMLLVKNREIDAQKKQVQLRESELLTADAEEALKRGDTRTAIESAISALPNPGHVTRPYYAPAESALLEAMDIFGGAEPPTLLNDTVLEQITPISNFCFSQDGIRAVTIDPYGVLRCFDTIQGEELWTAMIQEGASPYIGSGEYVFPGRDQNSLICFFEGTLECRDLDTGEQIWTRPLSMHSQGYFIYDGDRQRIACVDYNLGTNGYAVELVILSAGTGEIQQSIPFLTVDWMQSYRFANEDSVQLPGGGAFSGDGAYFAGVFMEPAESEGNTLLNCFVADLTQGTMEICYSQELEGSYYNYTSVGVELREDALFVALQVPDDTVAATVLKLDWKRGELLWQTTTPAEIEEQLFVNGVNTYVDFWDAVIFLGRSNGLYAIDMASGQILDSVFLPGTLTSLQAVSERNFGFSLSDGTYAIGWYNSNGITLTTDAFLQTTANIGEHDLVRIYKGGIVQLYTDGNYLEISVSNVKEDGCVAVVNAQQENQLVLKRPVYVEKPITQTHIDFPTKPDIRVAMYPVFCPDGSLILGPFGNWEEDNYVYYYAVLDTAAHTVQKIIPVDGDGIYSGRSCYFLPDVSGYIRTTSSGDVWLMRNGQETILAGNGEYSSRICAACTYLADGTLLTARVNADCLTLWRNGEGETQVPLPEEICLTEDMFFWDRFLKVGANGYILTDCHQYDEGRNLNGLSVYNAESGQWSSLSEDISFSNTDALALAKKLPLLALVDDMDNLRIMNLESGETAAAFPLGLPQKAVLYLDFLPDSTHMMVKTRDGLLLIYDIATGELNFRGQLGSAYTGELTAYKDGGNQRLYIFDSSGGGICLDLRSWTELGSSEGMSCFDERTGELYHYEHYFSGDSPLSFIRVPSTEELVQLGQQLLY